MRLLSGYARPDRGDIMIDGEAIRFDGPATAERYGIVLVHQELMLAQQLTVVENIFLGRETRRLGLLDRAGMCLTVAARLAALNCRIDPQAVVADLSIAEQQMVQIARALLTPQRVVIFAEPTAVLTPVEMRALFAVILKLKEQGTGILYISHRLSEVERLADRITVLRDGRQVGTYPANSLSQVAMAQLMVGRDVSTLFPPKPPKPDTAPILTVEGATVPGYVKAADFVLRPGEILGFAGLIGAGRTELFEGVLGLRPARIERITLDGSPVRFSGPRAAIAAGIGYLTEDRKGKGLLLRHQLAMNLTLVAPPQYRRGAFTDPAREQMALDAAIARFDIRVPDRTMLAGQLSGGNQQKLLLAKVMLAEPRILVIDEPTRGIDIGTKAQIYRFIADLALHGVACVVISSEMQELIGLCHRVLVMRAGRIVAELDENEMSEDAIVIHAVGAADNAGERAA